MEVDCGPRYAVVLNGETIVRCESSSLAFGELERIYDSGDFLVVSIMNIRAMNEGRKAVDDAKCPDRRASGSDCKRIGVIVSAGSH